MLYVIMLHYDSNYGANFQFSSIIWLICQSNPPLSHAHIVSLYTEYILVICLSGTHPHYGAIGFTVHILKSKAFGKNSDDNSSGLCSFGDGSF